MHDPIPDMRQLFATSSPQAQALTPELLAENLRKMDEQKTTIPHGPSIILSPDEALSLEHLAYDGEHPEMSPYGRNRTCPVCDGILPADKADPLMYEYAASIFRDSPLAARREARAALERDMRWSGVSQEGIDHELEIFDKADNWQRVDRAIRARSNETIARYPA